MKNFAAKLALLSALSLCGISVAIAEPPSVEVRKENVVTRVDLVQVPTAVYDKYFAKPKLKGELSAILAADSRCRIVTSSEILSQVGKPCLVHLGSKYPISYFDPRSSQFQIQYVDVGAKFDVNCKSESGGTYALEVRPETSIFLKSRGLSNGVGSTYPETDVVTAQVVLSGVQFHQSWVVGTVTTSETKAWLSAAGITTNEPQTLVYVVTMEKP